uniref:Uncharacterized protein n=1 Tax=Hyaloperonospora arabidopsidis (strain Emoy2) TaxID=559515 RepID=M4BSF6_HYAAE
MVEQHDGPFKRAVKDQPGCLWGGGRSSYHFIDRASELQYVQLLRDSFVKARK